MTSVSAAPSSSATPPPLPPPPPLSAGPALAVTHNAYDTAAWEQLLAHAFTLPIPHARPLYERFLSLFPHSSRYWRQYLLHEQSNHNYSEVEALFSRCLLPTLSLPLFQTYLDYVQHIKRGADDEADALDGAFDFALSHVGLDLHSPAIFLQYLTHLAAQPAASPMEETSKLQKQRRLFQRAVVVPGVGVEDVWREWDKFEHGVNRVLAVSLLGGEWNQRHLQAKAVGKERKRKMRGIKTDLLSTPPTPATATLHAQQLLLWRGLLAYERTNPLHLSPIDHHHQLVFTYRQALTYLSHHPLLWQEFLAYLQSAALELGGLSDSVEDTWKEAHAILHYSLTFTCMYAEWLEERGRLVDAKKVYEAAIDLRRTRARDAADREEEGTVEVKRRIAPLEAAKPSSDGVKMEDGEHKEEKAREVKKEGVGEEEAQTAVAEQAEDEEAAGRNITLLYIQLIRVVRRCEGPDAARKVFIAARRFKGLTHHAYIHAALLDYHVNKNAEFASKIFFTGLDKYDSVDLYTSSYLSFLHSTNDHSNLRLVIERIVKPSEDDARKRRQREDDDRLKTKSSKLKRNRPPTHDTHDDLGDVHLQPLWQFGCPPSPPTGQDDPPLHGAEGAGLGAIWWRYVQLERWTATELSTIAKAEERREVALGLHSPRTAVLIDRYRFLDLYPCSQAQRRVLSLMMRPDLAFGGGVQAMGRGVGQVVGGGKTWVVPVLGGMVAMDARHPPPDVGYLRGRYGGIGEQLLAAVMRLEAGRGEAGWQGPTYEVEGVVRGVREKVDERKAAEWVERTEGKPAGEVKEGAGGEGEGGKEGGKRKREEAGDGNADEGPKPTEPGAVGGDLFRQRRQSKMARQGQ